jgi:hypothetical protein
MTQLWSRPETLWKSSTWTDLSNSNDNFGSVKSLCYDSSSQTMFAGGDYESTLYNGGKGGTAPFIVSYDNFTQKWSDPSAFWNSSTWTDLSQNDVSTVYALGYDSSSQKMFAGGEYYSNGYNNGLGGLAPFIVSYDSSSKTWSDPSSVWHLWTDLSQNSDGNVVTSLGYDSSSQKMFAGGEYYSTGYNNGLGGYAPFIVYYDTSTQKWSDPSAVWHSSTWSDLSQNSVGGVGGIVNALGYDISNQKMFAGGYYSSNNCNGGIGGTAPFIVSYDSSTQKWSDPSAVWHSTEWSDLNQGSNSSVESLGYDPSSKKMFAGGAYNSNNCNNGNGGDVPFIVSYDSSSQKWSDPSAVWQSSTWTDLSQNSTYSSVKSLGYDNSTQQMFAGGIYHSKSFFGGLSGYAPFIVSYNKTTQKWSDPRTLWQSSTWTDLKQLGFGRVYGLGYDESSQQMFAGGIYTSFGFDNNVPFIVSYKTNTYLPISNICFIASTPITTDQGTVPIENIHPNIHTIRNKKILAITQTITNDKYLVCFEKNALGKNIPCEKTIMSKNHLLFHQGQMRKAKYFLGKYETVTKKKYKNGEILYNVLLAGYDKMLVNNLICETLHPESLIAKLYTLLPNYTVEKQEKIITKYNTIVKKYNMYL